jgi:hypothetical protein
MNCLKEDAMNYLKILFQDLPQRLGKTMKTLVRIAGNPVGIRNRHFPYSSSFYMSVIKYTSAGGSHQYSPPTYGG